MTEETFNRAVEIKSRLKEIDDFLFYMNNTWKVSITHKKPKTLFSNVAYGVMDSREMECDRALGDRLKDVVRDYRNEIAKEYEMLK